MQKQILIAFILDNHAKLSASQRKPVMNKDATISKSKVSAMKKDALYRLAVKCGFTAGGQPVPQPASPDTLQKWAYEGQVAAREHRMAKAAEAAEAERSRMAKIAASSFGYSTTGNSTQKAAPKPGASWFWSRAPTAATPASSRI